MEHVETGKVSCRTLLKAGVRCRLSLTMDLKFGPSLSKSPRSKAERTMVLERSLFQLLGG